MQNKQTVSAFYKYVKIENPAELKNQQIGLCNSLNVRGRILLGEEGINGSICGTGDSIKKYEMSLNSNPLFSDVEFKRQLTDKPAFRKLIIRVRNEIVHSGVKVDLRNTGKFLEPSEFKKILDRKEDIVLIDARNNYEARIGRFKNAITLDIKNFRDLPEVIKKLEAYKNKKIITYCTGGIRCEKASAFLKENGFNDVFQIKGGILKFGEQFPDTYWEGKCFVFDDRLAVDINNQNKNPLTNCDWCGKGCDNYLNCHNLDCDKLFICCDECKDAYNKSCSTQCVSAPRRRKVVVLANSKGNIYK